MRPIASTRLALAEYGGAGRGGFAAGLEAKQESEEIVDGDVTVERPGGAPVVHVGDDGHGT